MINILVIDPGLHKCGYFATVGTQIYWGTAHNQVKGRGAAAWYGMIEALVTQLPDVTFDVVVVETMNVYRGSRQKGTPEDLLQVQGVAGAVIGHFGTYANVFNFDAAVWTDGVPKKVRQNRVIAAGEYPKPAPPVSEHDAWDAYEIYLYWRRYDSRQE